MTYGPNPSRITGPGISTTSIQPLGMELLFCLASLTHTYNPDDTEEWAYRLPTNVGPKALENGVSYVSQLNVSSLEELRALDYSDFRDGIFGAVLDGYAMPDTYMNTLLHGAANNVPILTGNNKDESGAEYSPHLRQCLLTPNFISIIGILPRGSVDARLIVADRLEHRHWYGVANHER
ncbi:hypothetical protein BGZ61DRAFT_595309 [Ilyonectria robusta]|uniref:uncharacterized protein n=1 Tax=Ilyonectria robusta TaxID=1079257 RepID=UPI001E8DFF0F|nr:uncharacterized protein BGZ61DRAFT_595309 [Ilyonectria robusta]KAH8646923.1 hypothetical protein BGZ61DRAFT_595309 [Ilyonectria robusta]